MKSNKRKTPLQEVMEVAVQQRYTPVLRLLSEHLERKSALEEDRKVVPSEDEYPSEPKECFDPETFKRFSRIAGIADTLRSIEEN